MILPKINSRLIPFTPFSKDRSLRNIVTDIEAPSDTNVHKYKAIGMNILINEHINYYINYILTY